MADCSDTTLKLIMYIYVYTHARARACVCVTPCIKYVLLTCSRFRFRVNTSSNIPKFQMAHCCKLVEQWRDNWKDAGMPGSCRIHQTGAGGEKVPTRQKQLASEL